MLGKIYTKQYICIYIYIYIIKTIKKETKTENKLIWKRNQNKVKIENIRINQIIIEIRPKQNFKYNEIIRT